MVTDPAGSMTVRVIVYEQDAVAPLPALAPARPPRSHDALQLIRFCCVGASGFAVNLGVFRLADATLPYLLAFTLAFVLSALSNFVWNRLWTFPGAPGRTHGQLARFVLVSALALGLDLGILAVLVERAHVPALAAAAIAILVVTPVSFAGNKRWSFAGA
jgi:putative flippase GtrA